MAERILKEYGNKVAFMNSFLKETQIYYHVIRAAIRQKAKCSFLRLEERWI